MFLVKQNLPSMIGRCYRVAVIIILVLVDFIGTPNQAHASRNGRNGFSGNPDTNGGATCVVCHAVGANVPNVDLSGPTVVNAGTTHEFSVTINGGPAGTAGVNISVSDSYGTLSPKDSELHLIGTDLAHIRPKPFLGNEVTFSFRWTAPEFNANVTLYAAANSSNNQLDLLGDGINTATLNITVVNGQSQPPPPPPPPAAGIALDLVATGMNKPTVIAHAGDDRLFVVEQPGLIRVIDNNGNLLVTPFLDIQSRVDDSGNEMGLLGLAFHPDYAGNGYFYVYYTRDAGASLKQRRIARFEVSSDPNIADANSEQVIMEFKQPFENHNGGDLHFGPDGYLYIGSGDGGSGGDPQNNAQNNHVLLGKMLRIDFSGPPGANDGPDCDITGNRNYRIPPSNTFDDGTGGLGCDEIYASGLRNPWRFSFDRQTGDLWLADVGQNAYEEINFTLSGAAGGLNFGWRCFEGNHTFNSSGCTGNYFFPVHEYPLTNGNCSVIGGFVYRGSVYPALAGHYFYTDFCNPAILTLSGSLSNPVVSQVLPIGGINTPSSFGEDFSGELYIASLSSGSLYKIRALPANQPPTITNPGNQSSRNGSSITSLVIDATDPDGDPLSFSAVNLPPGLGIDPSTGIISGTLTATAGSYTATVTVSDGHSGGTASASFGWTVTASGGLQTQTFSVPGAITIGDNTTATPYPASVAVSGMSGTINKVVLTLKGLAHTYPADLDVLLVGPAGQKVMLMSDAGGGVDVSNANVTFDAVSAVAVPQSTAITTATYLPTNYAIGNTDAFPAPGPLAPYPTDLATAFNGTSPNGTWKVYVFDDAAQDSGQIANGFTLTITTGTANVNAPPVVANPGAQTTAASTNVNLQISASDADVGDNLSYSASGLPTGLTINSTTGRISGTTPTTAGSYTATVTVSDGHSGGTASASFGWTVTASGGLQTQTFSVPGAITIGDNTTATPYPASVTVSGMSGTINKVVLTIKGLAHTYPADLDVLLVGPAGQKVMLMSDAGGGVDVSNANVTFDAVSAVAVPQSTAIATATYLPTNYAIGNTDAFPAPGPLAPYPTDLATAFNGTSPNGTWKVYVFDDAAQDSGQIASGFTLTITTGTANVNAPPVVANPGAQTTAASTNVNLQISASDADVGDNLSYSASGLPTGLAINSTTGRISGTTATTAGSYTATVTVSDGHSGGTASASFGWTVTASGGLQTQTFSAPGAITIGDNTTATPYPASVTVSGMSGTINKVVLTLKGLAHTYPADLDVLLVGPAGQKVMLMSDAGGGVDVSNANVTFDAVSAVAVPQSTAIATATYLPTNYAIGNTDAFPAPGPLAPYPTDLATAFNGTSPNGTWKVYVFDDAAQDSGQIASGFTLTITAR